MELATTMGTPGTSCLADSSEGSHGFDGLDLGMLLSAALGQRQAIYRVEEEELRMRAETNAEPSPPSGNGLRSGSALREQIAALYDSFRPGLHNYIHSMGIGREQAEEMIQEAFLRLTDRVLQGDQIENLRGWVVRVVRNIATDYYRKNAACREDSIDSLEERERILADPPDPKASPEESYLEQERKDRLEAAVKKLNSTYRSCFELRMQGFGYKEIGIALDISTQRVAIILQRAAARLGALCE
ncbi:MAG: sigma-70 family RNA polymerase sigma factor [Terracidiphilus sp.]|nr:sigma-70 family RNA polymerase sigma factor [Terracidiphilus sp.]